MEPIVTTTLPREIFQRTCYICLEESSKNDASAGASAVCEKNGCRKAFHVTCAQKKGLLCEITKKNNKQQVVYSGFCGEHIPPEESGTIAGDRYRKIPAYPRISEPGCERASSSSGYSTPNNPEKSPQPPPSTTDPPSNSIPVVDNSASNTSVDNQRSSSIKSTASVGSSGTTESADSGIQTTVSELQPVVVEEKQAIRKPHKKSLMARMDNAGIMVNPAPSPVAASPSQPPQITFPYAPMNPTHPPPMPNDSGARYQVANPFADMPVQYDLSRPPMLVGKAPEMMQHVKMMSTGTPPPLVANMPLPRKRPLTPSILDSETLTISSLIERTIERATTSTTTLPPVVMPFTTGVRPPYIPDDKGMAPSPGGDSGGQKKPKKAAKESKTDPRRAGNTATIKDLLANTNLSPVSGQPSGHPSPQSEMFMQHQQQMMATMNSQKMQIGGVQSTPPRGTPVDMERNSQGGNSSSPFSRTEKPVSPKMINVARVHDDRHRTAVEKVQHYLTNQSGPEIPVMNNQPLALTTAQAPSSGGSKSKRKSQDERPSRAVHSATKANPSQPEETHLSTPVPAKTEMGRKSNGYVNGTGPNASTAAPPDEEMDATAAQAFDTLMMALSTFGTTAAHQTGAAIHPTVATTLDGFFRMQKELNMLKEKVGQLEGLKAFYLTQVQALRSLTEKHVAADGGGLSVVQPTMPEEVARLLSVLEPHDEAASNTQRRGPPHESASDGLLARLHEPAARDPVHRSSRDSSRPESRAQTATSASSLPPPPSSVPLYPHPPNAHLQTASSPSQTPKPYPRSRTSEREREREKEQRDTATSYAMTNGYPGQPPSNASSSSSSNRRGHYAHLEGMDGIPSGVISTPAPVASTPQLLMPNVAGTQFLLPGQQFYPMQMDPQRLMAMMPGQAFFPPALYGAPGMGGFIPAQNISDYTGLGRMHTPTTRYPPEDGSHNSGSQHPHSSMKREYEARETS
ncbi:protein AF-10-like isoform X2 [Paramacrobiotus metropolitanus]|nr:protein AF-10-like isoform X2 [Paramacrobiotus metropolitanus]XP_055337181.1 protein AF-10-like isoform X2 [Paramacrobiotus metropolitanus]XP_055337182.1 protein AF-10-like isoform X2 [Paramacrobiotus metropolitanus]XP_055337183.1 protein AF-10-like isoform X2 [Paramacrobiotus metropolitanus]XP_055337184.1 protein AF-10-like isoform X2 [Paramacrobiotus metropolitanus]